MLHTILFNLVSRFCLEWLVQGTQQQPPTSHVHGYAWDRTQIYFCVRAFYAARVGLFSYDNDETDFYIVNFGSKLNTRTKITRRKSGEGSKGVQFNGTFLDCNDYRYFIVSWSSHKVTGCWIDGQAGCLTFVDSQPFPINYISIGTYENTIISEWKIYLDEEQHCNLVCRRRQFLFCLHSMGDMILGNTFSVFPSVCTKEPPEPMCTEETQSLLDTTPQLETTSNHHETTPKHETTPNHHETTPNHHETSPNHHETKPRKRETTSNQHETTPNHHETTSSNHETNTSHHETTPNHHETTPNHHETTSSDHETTPNHHETTPNHHETTPTTKSHHESTTSHNETTPVQTTSTYPEKSVPRDTTTWSVTDHGAASLASGQQQSTTVSTKNVGHHSTEYKSSYFVTGATMEYSTGIHVSKAYCTCTCTNATEKTPFEKVISDLKIPRNSTKSHKMRLLSAYDDRQNAKNIGYVGILILCLAVLIVVAMDFLFIMI